VPTPRAQRPLPVHRPVRAPAPISDTVPQLAIDLAIDDVAQPQQRESLWDVLPFTHIKFSSRSIERVGDQTHISQRDVRLENGVIETQRFDGVIDADVCDELQRRMAYTALGKALELIFDGFDLDPPPQLPPLPPYRK